MTPIPGVMISCKQRADERALSLASLESHGVSVTVAESPCAPASRRENRRVGVHALTLAPPGSGVLFCEDDIRLNGRFTAFINLARKHDVVTVMCNLRDAVLSPVTREEIRSGAPMRPRLERASPRSWYGSQCMWLPRRVIDAVLSDPWRDKPSPGKTEFDGIDFLIRDVILSMGEPLFVALPNPVQHTAPPSVRAGKGQPAVSASAKLRADRPMSLATFDN